MIDPLTYNPTSTEEIMEFWTEHFDVHLPEWKSDVSKSALFLDVVRLEHEFYGVTSAAHRSI